MKKSLISLIALSFAFIIGAAQAADAPKPAEDPIAKACKGKKSGTEVTVAGKKEKCPEKKADATKK